MAFRLEDFKKVARKSAGSSTAAIYPHQIKDRKMHARIDMAIRSYDNLVGRPRKEMDAGAMVYFLGDHRVARGIVACLGQTYRYETLPVSKVAGSAAARLLSGNGLTAPADFRAKAYEHVNATRHGWVSESDRMECYGEVAAPYGVASETWDALMHRDAEENQVLTRVGEMPSPADIVAQYNYHSLDTVLRRATRVVLQDLALCSPDVADVRALASSYGCRAASSCGNTTVTLTDMEMSSLLPRRAGRLARCLMLILHGLETAGASGQPVSCAATSCSGYAKAQIGSRKFRLTLSPEVLRALSPEVLRTPCGGASPAGSIGLKARHAAVSALHKDLLRLRARGEAAGWRFKRDPDPIVTAGGLWLPDIILSRDRRQVALAFGSAHPDLWPIPAILLSPGSVDAADALVRAAGLLAQRPALAVVEVPGGPPQAEREWVEDEWLVAA